MVGVAPNEFARVVFGMRVEKEILSIENSGFPELRHRASERRDAVVANGAT
jgi:hypothetical protein